MQMRVWSARYERLSGDSSWSTHMNLIEGSCLARVEVVYQVSDETGV